MSSAFIPHVTITNAVGAAIQQNDRPFDDLVHGMYLLYLVHKFLIQDICSWRLACCSEHPPHWKDWSLCDRFCGQGNTHHLRCYPPSRVGPPRTSHWRSISGPIWQWYILIYEDCGCRLTACWCEENIIPVGVFGGRDASGLITSIGFVSFDTRSTANPPVKIFGELNQYG